MRAKPWNPDPRPQTPDTDPKTRQLRSRCQKSMRVWQATLAGQNTEDEEDGAAVHIEMLLKIAAGQSAKRGELQHFARVFSQYADKPIINSKYFADGQLQIDRMPSSDYQTSPKVRYDVHIYTYTHTARCRLRLAYSSRRRCGQSHNYPGIINIICRLSAIRERAVAGALRPNFISIESR